MTSFLGICQQQVQLCLLYHVQVSPKKTGLCFGGADLDAVAGAVMVPDCCGSHCAFSRDGGTEDVSSPEKPRLCGGSKCWQKNMEKSWFSDHFSCLRSNYLRVWVLFFCSETAQMNSGDAGNLDSVELCPICRATVLLSCQRYRKGKELWVYKHSTHSPPAPGMCLLC